MSADFTLQEKLGELRREHAMRRSAYRLWVRSGRLMQADADRQIALMAAIIRDYERLMKIEPGDTLFDDSVKDEDFTFDANQLNLFAGS